VRKDGLAGPTVTVKVKWADFRQCTRSCSLPSAVYYRETLCECSMALIRSVFPLRASIRLVGVTLSNFQAVEADLQNQLPLGARAAR
jgi:DNA polymerase-4